MYTHPIICPTAMKRAMKLVDPYSGKMQCRICGSRHMGILQPSGGYHHGAWQCSDGLCPTNRCRKAAVGQGKRSAGEIEPVLTQHRSVTPEGGRGG
jgi:hypothetical protein